MSKTLRIGLFQTDIFWCDISANFRKIENLLSDLASLPDILVLPETYTTGFIEDPGNISLNEIRNQKKEQSLLSKKFNITIIGSVVAKSEKKFANRLICTLPDGENETYNKRHLFGMGGESANFVPGNKRITIKTGQAVIMPLICYDLRFPVWSRNNLGYNILIYVANWPAGRINVWNTLLKARAIENACYTIGVNRVGTDGNSIEYNGNSGVYGPKGEEILFMGNKEEYAEVELSLQELKKFRKSFPVLNDADEFKIKTRKK